MQQNFSLDSKRVQDAFIHHLNSLIPNQQIIIDKSKILIDQRFICQGNSNGQSELHVNNLIRLFQKRQEEEKKYELEIKELNKFVISRFTQFIRENSKQFSEQNLLNQCTIISETIDKLTEPKKKNLAEQFLAQLMKNPSLITLNQCEEYIFYLLNMPFITAFPLDVADFMKNLFDSELITNNEMHIENITTQIINYFEKKLKPVEFIINDSNLTTFEKDITDIICKRQPCSLIVERLGVATKFLNDNRKDISYITLQISAAEFLQEHIPFYYESIKLTKIDRKVELKNVLFKLPRNLKELSLDFSINNHVSISRLELILQILGSLASSLINFQLDYRNNDFFGESMKLLSKISENANCKVTIHLNRLSFSGKHYDNIDYLMKIFRNTKSLAFLTLNFFKANISNEVFENLLDSFKNMEEIKELYFGLGDGNSISDSGLIKFFGILKKMVCLDRLVLFLNGGCNEITDNSMDHLADALVCLPSTLMASFAIWYTFLEYNIEHLMFINCRGGKKQCFY